MPPAHRQSTGLGGCTPFLPAGFVLGRNLFSSRTVSACVLCAHRQALSPAALLCRDANAAPPPVPAAPSSPEQGGELSQLGPMVVPAPIQA